MEPILNRPAGPRRTHSAASLRVSRPTGNLTHREPATSALQGSTDAATLTSSLSRQTSRIDRPPVHEDLVVQMRSCAPTGVPRHPGGGPRPCDESFAPARSIARGAEPDRSRRRADAALGRRCFCLHPGARGQLHDARLHDHHAARACLATDAVRTALVFSGRARMLNSATSTTG